MRKLGELGEKASWLDAEGVGEGYDIEKCYVSLATLDTSYVVAMEAGHFREFFLGEIPLQAQSAQLISKSGSGISRGHAVSLRRMTTMSLHTISCVYLKGQEQPDCMARGVRRDKICPSILREDLQARGPR